jgi:hypothetical protein
MSMMCFDWRQGAGWVRVVSCAAGGRRAARRAKYDGLCVREQFEWRDSKWWALRRPVQSNETPEHVERDRARKDRLGADGPTGATGPQGIPGTNGVDATRPDPPCFDNTNRYVDCGNGTVTDTVTGLIWLKNAGCLGFADWASANGLAATLANGQCGLTDNSSPGDWRLPNKDEWDHDDRSWDRPGVACSPTRQNLTNDAGNGVPLVRIDVVYWSGDDCSWLLVQRLLSTQARFSAGMRRCTTAASSES